jgi:L-amino acid N-acyltransferase YncA
MEGSSSGVRATFTRALLRRLTERGYRPAFRALTQPYEPSNGFHRPFGFRFVSPRRMEADGWYDVAWL